MPAYASGKGHGQPWKGGVRLASAFLAPPNSPPVGPLQNQGGI